jgi:ABC-type antimicrobial peptide transport system permease subunit
LLISNVSTMERQVESYLVWERLVAALSATFGSVTLALACIGLYGLLAYSVTRRTNELGIRMALGATRSGIVGLVLREALLLAGAGILIGIPLALAAARATSALLFGVGPFDLPAFTVAALLLLAVAAIATIVPGRRAGRLDPSSALRRE